MLIVDITAQESSQERQDYCCNTCYHIQCGEAKSHHYIIKANQVKVTLPQHDLFSIHPCFINSPYFLWWSYSLKPIVGLRYEPFSNGKNNPLYSIITIVLQHTVRLLMLSEKYAKLILLSYCGPSTFSLLWMPLQGFHQLIWRKTIEN